MWIDKTKNIPSGELCIAKKTLEIGVKGMIILFKISYMWSVPLQIFTSDSILEHP